MYEPLFPINATKKGRKKNFYHVIQNLAHESTKMSLSITTLDSISGTHPGLLSGQLAWVKWLWWSDCSQKVWSDDLTSFALSIKNEKQLCPKVIEVLDLAVVKVRNIHCPGAERNWVAEALGGRKKKISQLICRIFPQTEWTRWWEHLFPCSSAFQPLDPEVRVHSAIFTTVARSGWGILQGLKTSHET